MGSSQSSTNPQGTPGGMGEPIRDAVRSLSSRILGATTGARGGADGGGGGSAETAMARPSAAMRVGLGLRRARQQFGSSLATIDVKSGRETTWSQVADRVARLAAGLTLLGLRPGGRVAILSLNSDVYFELMFACAHAGGIAVPLNYRLSPAELTHVLNDSGPTILCVDETFAKSTVPKLHPLPSSVKKLCLMTREADAVELLGAGAVLLEDVLQASTSSGASAESMRGGDDVFALYYTGGTTGLAKGVMLTHLNVMTNALGTLVLQNDFSHQTRYLHVAPMFHLADAQHVVVGTMAACTHVFVERFVPPELLGVMDRFKVDKLVLVPAMIQMLLAQPDVEKQAANLASRTIEFMYGGSPMPKATMAALLKLLPKARLMQGFGMTESAPAISLLTHEDHMKNDGIKMTTVGRPVAWVEVIVADERGIEVPRGTQGEILVRGPNVMAGYWGLKELSSATLAQGFLHTGDGAYMDDDGYLVLCDRIKDMIKSGGENVFSAEVEKVLAEIPGVAMCAVVGLPDEQFGEAVCAVIQPKPGVNKDDLALERIREFCKSRLAGYKVPKRVVLKDALPMSGAGKILKHALRKELGVTSRSGGEPQERKTAYA